TDISIRDLEEAGPSGVRPALQAPEDTSSDSDVVPLLRYDSDDEDSAVNVERLRITAAGRKIIPQTSPTRPPAVFEGLLVKYLKLWCSVQRVRSFRIILPNCFEPTGSKRYTLKNDVRLMVTNQVAPGGLRE
ncbi:unnamed protein product, partial [Iphiclides podalirius]